MTGSQCGKQAAAGKENKMKITKQRLKEIIKEELSETMTPESEDYHRALGVMGNVILKLKNLDARGKDLMLDSADIEDLSNAHAHFKSIKPPTFE
jgi:hypothetical protein